MPQTFNTNPGTLVFTPVTVPQVTLTGEEGWRTAQRVPPFYGVFGVASLNLPATLAGISSLQRFNLMQPVNTRAAYKLGQGTEGDTQNG